MIEEISFQARARTVDHLGREQIADCPTAISELWKNSFDAYARNVELNVFDAEEEALPIAVLHDDGHGMSEEEFISKWLVIGTESKAGTAVTDKSDRYGLPERPRQGQKGIGRLSCANLGPLLLLVSKRKNSPFVAGLLDWRIFENPYLFLSDIRIPVTQFEEKSALFDLLPQLFEKLKENIDGDGKTDRAVRIKAAWEEFDAQFDDEEEKPTHKIRTTVDAVTFGEGLLNDWPVWSEQTEHGTAMLIADINYDLNILSRDSTGDDLAKATKRKLKETLTHFVDPFSDQANEERNSPQFDFNYSISVISNQKRQLVLSSANELSVQTMDSMEHVINGYFDNKGVFHGKVKAFGQWREGFEIKPPSDLPMPKRSDTRVGSCSIYIAAMEWLRANSTHSDQEYEYFRNLADDHAGFMVFRDGLRVMPYGRVDNDFFEIEERRSKSAGREFWNKRQMFGRLSLSRAENPNLRDKAGREGFIDNRAAKTLKALVSNVLMQSARRFFGTASDIRKELLPEIQEKNATAKAEKARDQQKRLNQKRFRAALKKAVPKAEKHLSNIQAYSENLSIQSEQELNEAYQAYEQFSQDAQELKLPPAPVKLCSGTLI